MQPGNPPQETSKSAVFRVPREHAGLRADAYLAMVAPFLSRTRIRQKIQQGEALRNGRRFSAAVRLQEDDRIEVRWREEARQAPAAAPSAAEEAAAGPPLRVLYEDELLIGLDKPAGMPVHPVGRKQSGTLIQAVQARFRPQIARSLAAGDGSFYPSLVNRLDLFTSGVVLVAKTRRALLAMHRLIAAGGIRKRYLALAHGDVEPAEGRIELPIGPDEGGRIAVRRAVRPDGLPSVTEYRVVERLPGYTLVHAWPLTGRQHQIRVHFAAAGHPIWGDLIYADERLFQRYLANGCRLDETLPPRQGLHAQQVAFTHPFTGEAVEISAPLPEDLAGILDALRRGPAGAPPA